MRKVSYLLSSLSSRLALFTLLLAIVLGIIFSALQVCLDYFNVKDELHKSTDQVLQILLKPATQAAYHMDAHLANEVALSILRYKPIYKVLLLDDGEQVLAQQQREVLQSNWRWLSDRIFGYLYIKPLPLVLDEDEKVYGYLHIFLDTHQVAEAFLQRALIVIYTGILRNLLLGAILFFLFHYWVNRPLSKMVRQLGNINPTPAIAGHAAEVNCPKGHEKDELGRVVESTNHLLKAIETQVQEREEILRTLAVTAEQNARLYQMAAVDSLTGLYVRRYFEVRCQEEFTLLGEQGGVLSLLMIDIDYFKRINDTYGHPQGDAVLRELGQMLLNVIHHDEHVVVRYGGEEFLVLLRDTDAKKARQLAECIRANCEHQSFTTASGELLKVTLSIGVACTEQLESLSCQSLIQQADNQLYCAKKNGRNQVCTYYHEHSAKLL